MKLFLIATVLAGTILPATAQTVVITPAQLGQIYCIGSLGNDMKPVEAVLTRDFSNAIMEAEQNNDNWVATHADDEKPPLGDGLPWRKVPDYADGCSVGDIVENGDEAMVAINFSFSDQPEANYTNHLSLERATMEADAVPRWRISNIEFSANDGGTMRQTLFEAFAF